MPDSLHPSLAGARGQVVRTFRDGQPILWSYGPELPSEAERRLRPWLMVLAWPYDGAANNGMPDAPTQQQMRRLDEALGQLEERTGCAEAYRRIGAGRREFVFYATDSGQFMARLNEALADHPPYPLDIRIYEDERWSDFQQLLDDFSVAGRC